MSTAVASFNPLGRFHIFAPQNASHALHMVSSSITGYLRPHEAAYFKRTSLTIWKAFLNSELHLIGEAALDEGFEKVTATFAKMIQMGRCPENRFTILKVSHTPKVFSKDTVWEQYDFSVEASNGAYGLEIGLGGQYRFRPRPNPVLRPVSKTKESATLFTASSMQHIARFPLTRIEFEDSAAVRIADDCFQFFATLSSLTELLLPVAHLLNNILIREHDALFDNTLKKLTGMKLQHLRIKHVSLKDEDFSLFTNIWTFDKTAA